ncbi:MAG: pentapeptide repeat-containing protein [Rhodomicrobium sp.]
MTRDETIALWQKCEQAETAALANGKSHEDAHEAAKAVWNSWAEPLVARRRVLEAKGLLKSKKRNYEDFIVDWKLYDKEEAEKFLEVARCHFSEHLFDTHTNFRGFIFPGDAWFGRVYADVIGKDWEPANFETNTYFSHAVFHGDARFDRIVFEDYTGFESTIFLGDAGFDQVATSHAFELRRESQQLSRATSNSKIAYWQQKLPTGIRWETERNLQPNALSRPKGQHPVKLLT